MLAYSLYTSLLLIMSGLLIYFGAHFCFSNIPSQLKNSVYDNSRKLIGVGYLIISASILCFYAIEESFLPAKYSVSANLICYYIIAGLFALAFLSLLANRPCSTLYVYKTRIISWFIFPVPLLLSVLLGNDQTVYTVQIISATFFFITIVLDIVYAFFLYEKSKKINQIQGSTFAVNTKWILNSIYLIVIMGVTSCAIAFAVYFPKWVLVVYLLYIIGVFIYIFEKYHSAVVDLFESMREVNESNLQIMNEMANKKTLLPTTISKIIESGIVKWVQNKGYCDKNLTAQSTAATLGTNRSYLSLYVNTTYDCSFKIWIAKLRIDEAKNILSHERGVAITNVAERVGFQSLSSFTHTFSNLEGVSPRKWAEKHVVVVVSDN